MPARAPSAESNILGFEVEPASGKLTQLNQVVPVASTRRTLPSMPRQHPVRR